MTIDAKKLHDIYLSRPDLQQVYNPDGSAINPSDPRVKGIPTLNDWAMSFGLKENPDLDPTYASLSKYFTPEQIAGMPDDIKTGLAAFADVQAKNFEAGKVNADINARNWNDAMATAANDPNIKSKYGDQLTTAINNVNRTFETLGGQFNQDSSALARSQPLETKALTENEDAAGRAYSGFRTQAEAKLKADQGDIIKSSLRNLQTNINSATKPFEQTYGSDALSKLNLPTIGGESVQPIGGLTGTDKVSQASDIRARATDIYDSTINPTQK